MATLTKTDSALTAPEISIPEKRKRQSTFVALRNPNFRIYFGGQLVSITGTWMQNVAQGFLVFSLTKSEFWLGIVACAAGLPMLFLSPFAGVVVERIPRRTLMIISQTIQMLLAFILAALTFSGLVQVWHIVALAGALGMINALDMPARQTLVVEVVGREDMRSGIALNSILNSTGRVLGPTAAGLALVQFGPAVCFLLNGLSFVAVLISLFFMKVPYAQQHKHKGASVLEQLKEGMSYARADALIAPLLMLAALVGFFFVPVMQMLPAFADVILNSPKEGYAILNTGMGVGSVVAGVAVGWLTQSLGAGKLIAYATGLSAAATIVFAMQISTPLAAVMCGFMGLFLVIEMIALNTSIQTIVPDHFRGRVLSLYTLALLGLAPFGALALGTIASLIGTGQAIALYGVISAIIGAIILIRWPLVGA
jgi:MFS family permease